MTTTPNQTTFREAMVDAARARGGAGAEFIARGETNLWLDIAMDAFAALQSPTDREGDRLITLWRKTGEQCLDWDFHISENTHELREVLANLGKQEVRQITTYRLGAKVEALAHLSRSIVGEGE